MKKKGLDLNDESNYSPVSNLRFLSKVIKRVVAKNLLNHLVNTNLLPVFQSGIRKFHSTGTALIDIVSTLIAAIDNKNVYILAHICGPQYFVGSTISLL